MTTNPQENQAQVAENKPSDKEINFRKQEEMFKKQLEQERVARQQAEERAKQLEAQRHQVSDDDDDDGEPYIDRKKLKKEQAKFGQQIKEQTQSEIQKAVSEALVNERRQTWLKSNPDFYDVMQHAQKFAEKDPELAETILEMPEGFERQKLVYKNIKALGLHKKEEPKPSIQETIDKQKRSPYYQPSGVGTAPYANAGDFSPAGQKNAYEKLLQLKKNLRLG